jgi:hypothetical protein
MVKVLQKKFGKKHEPNAYAKLRVGRDVASRMHWQYPQILQEFYRYPADAESAC